VPTDVADRIRGAFEAIENPTLSPEARSSLAPALRARRISRQRRLVGVALLCALAGLGGSLPFALRSGPKPDVTAATAPPNASCVEVAVGEAGASCEGVLIALPEATSAYAPSASQNLSEKSLGVRAPQPLSVAVGERLRVRLPAGRRWSGLSVTSGRPDAESGGVVRIQQNPGNAREVTVVATRPGEVTLGAIGTRPVTHQAGTSTRAAPGAPATSWVLVLRVVPKP